MVEKTNPKDYYIHLREIGKGGFGKVYVATRKDNKQKVAIKQIQKSWEDDVDNITNEIALLNSCRHTNIINYITSYLYQNKVWMVMEYCDGGTLKQLLVVELTENQIANIVQQVLKGINFLHNQNRIHRDIKSSNILLNMNGEVKVADLGLCIEAEGEHSGIAGSKYWMAPEMIKRQSYTSKVDIWSIGALTVEMAEGSPPYYEYKPLKALFYTATKGAPPLKHLNKWSDSFKDFLKNCFEENPDLRPSSNELLKHPFLQKACSQKELVKTLKIVFLMRVTAGL